MGIESQTYLKPYSDPWAVSVSNAEYAARGVSPETLAPRADWGGASESEHLVQFYESDGFPPDSLGAFAGEGLEAGDACIAAATREHLDGLEERLRARGLDLAAAAA